MVERQFEVVERFIEVVEHQLEVPERRSVPFLLNLTHTANNSKMVQDTYNVRLRGSLYDSSNGSVTLNDS